MSTFYMPLSIGINVTVCPERPCVYRSRLWSDLKVFQNPDFFNLYNHWLVKLDTTRISNGERST